MASRNSPRRWTSGERHLVCGVKVRDVGSPSSPRDRLAASTRSPRPGSRRPRDGRRRVGIATSCARLRILLEHLRPFSVRWNSSTQSPKQTVFDVMIALRRRLTVAVARGSTSSAPLHGALSSAGRSGRACEVLRPCCGGVGRRACDRRDPDGRGSGGGRARHRSVPSTRPSRSASSSHDRPSARRFRLVRHGCDDWRRDVQGSRPRRATARRLAVEMLLVMSRTHRAGSIGRIDPMIVLEVEQSNLTLRENLPRPSSLRIVHSQLTEPANVESSRHRAERQCHQLEIVGACRPGIVGSYRGPSSRRAGHGVEHLWCRCVGASHDDRSWASTSDEHQDVPVRVHCTGTPERLGAFRMVSWAQERALLRRFEGRPKGRRSPISVIAASGSKAKTRPRPSPTTRFPVGVKPSMPVQ